MLPRSQPAFHLATGAYAVLAMNYLAPMPWHQAGRLGFVKSLLGSLCIALGLVSHTTSRGILLMRCHKDGLRMLVRHCQQKRQDQRSTVCQLSNSAHRSWCLISKLYESMKVDGRSGVLKLHCLFTSVLLPTWNIRFYTSQDRGISMAPRRLRDSKMSQGPSSSPRTPTMQEDAESAPRLRQKINVLIAG